MKPQENNNPYNIREINYSVNDSFKRPQISIQTKAETDKLEAKAESINIQNPQLRVELLNEKESENLKKKAMMKLLLSSERFGDDANFLLKNSDKVIFRSDDGHTVFVPEYKAKIYAAQNPTATQIPDTKKYVNDALETLSKQYTQEEYLKGKPEYAKRLDDLYKTFTPETKGKARAEAVNNLYENIYGEEVGQAIENQITLIDESIAKYREKLEADYVDDIKTGKTTALSRFLGSYKGSELRNLNLAEDLIGRIKDELRARKNQSGFWRSVIVDTNWSNILTADIESIYDAATERNLFKRLDQYGIDNLREDEKLLLDALVAGEAIKNYPKELTTLYNVGSSIVPSLLFMATYWGSGAILKGVKSGVKKIAEAALKKYIKQRAKELGVKTAAETTGKATAETAKKTFTQKAKDLTARTGKALATAAGQVVLTPRSFANVIESYNGDVQVTPDGFGENTIYMYDGREISETPLRDAFLRNYIDIVTEKAGALIPFNKLNLGKYFGKAIPGDSKFWQNTRKFISGVGGDRLKRAVDFNGFIGEYSEELIAGTLNSMLVGDQKIEDVFAKQNMIETALSVGVISLGMGLVSGGLSIPASKKVKKEFLAAEEELKKVIPSPREREKFIREVATAGYKQQAAVMNKFVQAAENAKKSGDMESSATYIEAANIIGRYMNAYNRYQTYNSYLDEQIKEKLETEKSAIQEAANPDMDNNIVVADYYGKNVKVVAGKVEFNEDGTVNTENSSESIVILNDDGSKQQVSPQGLTLKDMYESSELEAEAEARIRNEVQMQSDAATAEGKREYLTDEQAAYIRELGIHGIEVDDELDAYYTEDPELNLVVAEARQRYPGTPNIGQQAQSAPEQEQMQAQYPRDAKGNPDFAQITPEQAAQILTTEYPEDYAEFVQNKVAAAEKRIEKASKAKPQSTDLSDIKTERDAIMAEQTAAQQEYDYWNNVKTLLNQQDVNTTEQIAEEQPADANLSVAENETLQPGQTVEETTAAKQEEQQQYPTDEAGEPLWYEMTEKQFDVAMTELGDDADAFIADNIKEAQKAKKKAEKAKPKSAEFAKRKAEQQAISAEKDAAQKAYDFWMAQQARRIGASQKKAPQITQQVGENITGKYQTSNRTYGNTDTYILPSGEKINGRYVIVESDAITPSHDVNNGYQKSEGFPTDENGNTINDRDYHADKSAQTIVEQNAANYDARAIQTPVIVTNQGIVLSGNGRTMSGQIAASQGTDTEYLSYLKDHAGRYGFTAEQISGYQHPRLVLEVSDNVPLNAETFAKFNAEDKKTISPTEKAVKAGKTVTDITLEKIAALLDDKETLSDVYADETATAQIIKILQSDGVININEVAELMDGKKLSAQGKDFLETLLVGKILNEQSVRLVAQMRNIRATVIKSIMPLLNNSRLRKGQNGENYSLSDELNKAIEFIYAADRANMPITDYLSQTNLFDANPADIYDTATQIIAVALTKGQNNFKQFVNKYNTAAEHAASGQIDIFAGRIKTKKEILKEITGTYGNTGQAAADTQSRLGNSKVKSGIQSVRGDDAGNRGADTGGRGTEQGTERVTTTADTAQTAAAGQTTETPAESSNLPENEAQNAASPSGGDSNLSDTEERYRESEEPVSPETLAKDRAELEEIFGKSFFPNVFETVKKRTAERMSEVSKAAKEFKAELKNAPEIILISDINDILKYDTQVKTIDDVYRRMTVKGWYSPGNGKAYVNLASHLTPEDVKATILHEAVGHSGLRRLLGKDAFDRLCNTVYQSMPEDKQKKMLEATRKIHPNATDEQLHLIVGDEYMATLAEGGAEQSIPQRIISAVRDFLRSIGIDLEINEADLRYLLHASYKNIKDADAVTVVNNSALLTRLRKAAEETHIKSEAESLFRLGKKSRDAYERLLEEKRPDMPENMRKEALDYLDSLEDTKANTKKIKIAVKWLADGTIRLPEDADKVDTAIEYANRKGIDAMQYNSPLDLIDALKGHVNINEKPIDPDTVKELTNKVEYGDGLTVYEVENSEAGRQAMRRIINTHFGKDASPWCLLQGDSEGNLTSQSAQYWQHYNAYPKRVAFKDGKLLAFFANDEDTPVWWDRLDRPNYNGIPVTGKIKGDPLGRSGTRIFNERTKTFGKPLDIHKGNKQNGTYEAWHYNGQMRVRAHYKNGIPVGNYESWYENGNPLVKTTYNENGDYNGLYEDWYEDGQQRSRINYKDGVYDGLREEWYDNGRPERIANYKDGKLDGFAESWHSNGKIGIRGNYKNDKKNGIYKTWDIHGNLKSKYLYENDVLKEVLPLDDNAEEVRFRKNSDFEAEEQAIINRAKSDDTYMKAPNGEPTKLTPKQWVQVRTRAFIEWFGDWEKAARIEKLRQSEPAEITGKEVTPSDDLKQYKKNALEYGKNLRSEYTNKDTGETISLTAGNSRGGIREILQHDYKDVEHLQSIAAIPHIIENSIFIDEQPNEDLERYPGVKSFSYYVCGLKIGGVDYTVKAVIANQNNGERYYDHKLTNIEKGELLSIAPTIQKAGIDSKTPYPAVKDKRLLSLLQTNSSKVVDENGEPRVIDGLYLNIKERNPITRLDISINKANNYVNKISEIENETGKEWDNESIFYQEEKAYNLLESIVSQKDYIEILINSIRKGIIPSIVVAYRYGDINERGRSYNYRDQIFEQGISVVGRVSELNTNIDKYYELFYGEQPYNIVVGVYSGNRGADGEILLTPATKLGLVENLGNIIKSATDNTGSFSSENADIRFRMDNDLEAVNRRFNEELEQQINGTLPQGHIYKLGRPGKILRSTGIPDLPIELSATRLATKARQENHPFNIADAKDLVSALNNPIAVFEYGNKEKAQNVIVEIERDGKKFVVGIHLNQNHREIIVNDIRGIFPKDNYEWLNWISQGKLLYADKEKIQTIIDQQRINLAEVAYLDLDSIANIIKNFENPNFETEKNTEDIRFRLDTPEEQQVIIASEASERTYTETDKAPEIDYDMPATDVIEQISAKSSVEPLFRQGAFDKDFAAIVALQDAIKQTSLYQQNASSKELANRLNVGLYDAMAPLKDFISQIEESRGQKIDDDHNPYYLENASASKAQERIESLKRDNIKPLAETTNDAAQLLQGREMLKLYLTGKTGIERQEIKESSQQAEGFYDFAGLTGLQRMLIIQQIGEANITDEVITTLNGLDYPQLLDYANEHNYQTIDKYVETCDKKLGDTGITLWEQIRDLSKKQLRGQYDAGLISRDAYYYLTTGIRISDLLAANRDNGIISDKKYNNISDTDMDVSELRDKGYITQQQYDMLNTYKPLYLYYLPLKGDASITASDINDYESREQKNKSKISKVKGHENLSRDPLTQLVSDCYGAIQNEEHNRWLREVLRAARLSNLSDNVVKITPLNVGATRVATEGETAAKQGKKRNERLIADVKATNKQVDEHSVIVFDGGRAYKMTFADLSLAKALRTSGGRFADASAFVNWASRKTRAWAMMLTTLNPMFVASNTFRDVGEALFVNYVNLGAKAIPVFVRAWNPANKLQQALHRHLKGKPGNTPYDALVKEYFDNGGPTSYSMMPDFDKIKSDMDKMVRDSKRGNYNPVKMGKTVLDWLEVQAKHSELLSRVATYAMYRGTLPEYNIGKNASITEAIWQSKEVTVNFDKRGAWAKELGVTSLFWNAGRQSNRIHYNLLKNHPVRYLAATAAMSSIKVALPGLLSTLVSYLYGDEKGKEYLDKYYAINRYTRFNNLCLLWGDAIVKIPISPSFGPTAIMSEIVSEMIYTDFDKDRALSMTADLAQSMATLVGNDIFGSVVGAIAKGEPKELIGAIPFAIAQPFAELLANRNWQGRQIMRDYQGLDYLPAYYKAYGNVEDYYIESAKWINKITGGDEGKPGKLNKLIGNPAANKHIIESYLGGLGSFIFDSLNTGANIVNGRWDRVIAESPFKRFLGDPEVYQDQEAWEDYYTVKSKINEYSARINSYKQTGNERKAYKLEDVRDELKYLLKPYDDYIDASKEDMQEALNRNPKDAREIRRKHRRDMAKYLKTLKKQIEHIDTDL